MRIVIVDDNEINLVLFSELAQGLEPGLDVKMFADPTAALAHCTDTMPDLLLVDYMMPGMDGHELIQALRALPSSREVPIVMVTAADERRVRQRALELGATDFLAKPIDPNEVKARLRNLLDLRRSHQKLKDRNKWLAEEVKKATSTILAREQELILRLAKAAEYRDPETGGHIQRMAHYSKLIAETLGQDEETCELMLQAAPMHDIGKLGIPDGILLKPGRLDEDEFAVMKQHPDMGYAILQGSQSRVIEMAAEIALSHHEKWDGSGYPKGLSGAAIPLSGRIVAVADVFDALTSVRPYKRAWSLDQARDFLASNAGSHFDPSCVEAFLSRWDDVKAIQARYADAPPPSDDDFLNTL